MLLSYGKSWTQEPEEALPAEAAGRELHLDRVRRLGSDRRLSASSKHGGDRSEYTGGLIVENGSGWHEDPAAAAALGTAGAMGGRRPARRRRGLHGAEPDAKARRILERQSPGAPWQSVAPIPAARAPGSLALFREGGALRAIGAGG